VTNLKTRLINQQRGQYVKKNVREAVGVCDYSGFFFSKSDLIKQYEWRGNNLVWTGAIVGRPFADEPNEQNRPPQIKGDPKTVSNPRPEGLFTPQPPDATGNNLSSALNNVNFTSVEANPKLPSFAGEDISSINADQRLKLLEGS
jgi:hypothetical protein